MLNLTNMAMSWRRKPQRQPRSSPQQGATGNEERQTKSEGLGGTQETDASESFSAFEQEPIQIIAQHRIYSVAFLADGEHMVCGSEKKIHCWRMKDGKEVGTPMDVGDTVCSIAVSLDGKQITSGTEFGEVAVWDMKSREKVKGFKLEARNERKLAALDISPDTKKIAGVSGNTAHIWSLDTRKRLHDLAHDKPVHIVKFSPDSCLIATGSVSSFQIYDSENGRGVLPDALQGIRIISVAWASNSKKLFALSCDGNVHYLDVSSGTEQSWRTHTKNEPRCISLANNDAFVAVSTDSSVSLWDTSTRQQIGEVICHSARVEFIAISVNYALVISASPGITLRNLHAMPSPYVDDHKRLEVRCARAEAYLEKTIKSLQARNANGPTRSEGFANLDNAVQKLQDVTKQKVDKLNETIGSLRANLDTRSTEREETIKRLEIQLADSRGVAKQTKDTLEKTTNLEKTNQELRDHLTETQQFADNTLEKLAVELSNSRQTVDSLTKVLRAYHLKHRCETMYADGQVIRAARLLLEVMRSTGSDAKADSIVSNWLSGFKNECIIRLEKIGDELSGTEKHDERLAAYTLALTLGPSSPNALLKKWANVALLHGSSSEALEAAKEFNLPRFSIYRVICDDIVEKDGRVMEGIKCFQQMQTELTMDSSVIPERADWERDFPRRCSAKLKKMASNAMEARKYNETEGHFSNILLLYPQDVGILISRAETRIMMKSWEGVLVDANKVIELDPSSYGGYKLKYEALHMARRYKEAVAAFDTMLSKLNKLPPDHVDSLRPQYTDPRPKIREIVPKILSEMPKVLIDTTTGQLLDKTKQKEVFEADPIFDELISSMTTNADDEDIEKEVKKFYRYAMLSHKWLKHEPSYKDVKLIGVYKLKDASGDVKLKTFCAIVHSELRIRWAWSDTCCIDQENDAVLRESLISMFGWYRGSYVTIVHLADVSPEDVQSRLEDDNLQNSIWNKRAWTYQEYVAARVVKFYTKDWKLYPGLTSENHKDEQRIILQMERAINPLVKRLAISRPDLERVREKLFVASKRQAERKEDIAYSLFGIFDVTVSIMYGEGTRAIGRFLECVLAKTSDVSILAWKGPANGYNSCLPLDLTVYDPLEPPHIPSMETNELDEIVMDLQSSNLDTSLVTTLYDELSKLELGVTSSGRLQLPCIRFPISKVTLLSSPADLKLYLASTIVFGDVKISTANELDVEKESDSYYLIHPWIHTLLDQEHLRGERGLDKTIRALRLVARLRQPFGALLFEKLPARKAYKRVASDSLIMVTIPEKASLTDLIDNFERIDVL